MLMHRLCRTACSYQLLAPVFPVSLLPNGCAASRATIFCCYSARLMVHSNVGIIICMSNAHAASAGSARHPKHHVNPAFPATRCGVIANWAGAMSSTRYTASKMTVCRKVTCICMCCTVTGPLACKNWGSMLCATEVWQTGYTMMLPCHVDGDKCNLLCRRHRALLHR